MNYTTCTLMGGLGNYLFQIATAYSVSLRDGKDLILNDKDITVIHDTHTKYLNNIFKNLKFTSGLKDYVDYNEPAFNFNEIPKIEGNVRLVGHFQSEKYFKDYREEVLKLFKMSDGELSLINEKYGDILKLKTCALHVRRGDYLRLQNYHKVQGVDYYKKAVDHFDEDTHFLIFSDDIKWCRENLDFIKNKTFIDGNPAHIDLYLMSITKANIIANSSFSWWGAWLNGNSQKTITPKEWFGVSNSHFNTSDLYCNNWIVL